MKSFEYHRATSLAEAVALLQSAPDSRVLAGGQSLLPTLRLGLAEPTALVDVARIPGLAAISASADTIRVGAMARHAAVVACAAIRQRAPALAYLAGGIGDRQIRSVGTLGGSLANNDPSACYPAAALALDAVIHTNRRTIDAQDFFRGLYATALDSDEIISHVDFTVPQRAAYVKFPQAASKFALVGVFVAVLDRGLRVAVTGASSGGVYRDRAMEAALERAFSPGALQHAVVDPESMLDDLHAPADYRAHLVRVAAMRAVQQLVTDA